MKQHFILGIAVVMGLLAALFTKQYISAQNEKVRLDRARLEQEFKFTQAVIFKKDLPSGAVITGGDIQLSERMPAAHLRTGAVTKDEAGRLLNRRTANFVQANVPVFWTDIEGGDDSLRPSLARDIKGDMRVVSINVTGSASVSGQVRPNDHVDVIGTFVLDSPDRPNEKEQVTLTILQNVTVIATGAETARSLARATPGRAASYSMVSLVVTPREAETLVACEQNRGKLTLSLRNPDNLYYVPELPTVDFKFIRETLTLLNDHRQRAIIPGAKPAAQ